MISTLSSSILLAPPNATTGLALFSAYVPVAGAVFLRMKLHQPRGGIVRISSASMVHARLQFVS